MAEETDDVRMSPNSVTPSNPSSSTRKPATAATSAWNDASWTYSWQTREKGKPPIILYPDECWYDGVCVQNCPHWQKGAITLNHPLSQRVRWKRKATGEDFRIGMPNPPPPNNTPPGRWLGREGVECRVANKSSEISGHIEDTLAEK